MDQYLKVDQWQKKSEKESKKDEEPNCMEKIKILQIIHPNQQQKSM